MLVRLSTYARGTTYVCVCTVSKTARVRYLEWRVCGTTYVRVVSSIARVVSRIARAVLALRGRYLESCACAVSRSCAVLTCAGGFPIQSGRIGGDSGRIGGDMVSKIRTVGNFFLAWHIATKPVIAKV